MTAPALHRTTVTIWTNFDPDNLTTAELGGLTDNGQAFYANRNTEEVPVSTLLANPSVGDDLLEFFGINAGPVCQVGWCHDEGYDRPAVALMPRVKPDGTLGDWILVCQSHADDWWTDEPAELRVRFDLHRFPAGDDVDERLAHLTTGDLSQLGRRVYNVLEYGNANGAGQRGHDWGDGGDTLSTLDQVFDAYGVRFTSPDEVDNDGQGVPAFLNADKGESVRGCPCGEADYGAPGHEGHADTNREGYVVVLGACVHGKRVPVAEAGPFREYCEAFGKGLRWLGKPAGDVLNALGWDELEGGAQAEQEGALIVGFSIDVYVDGETLYSLNTNQAAPAAPHGCGLCGGPLRFCCRDAQGIAGWTCTRCAEQHTSKDCCEAKTAAAAPARAVPIRTPRPFDSFSAAHTRTAIAAYDPDSARCQKFGPDFFLSEQELGRYMGRAGSATVVFDLDRATGQWAARKMPAPAAKPSRSDGLEHGDWKLTSQVPDEIAAEQGWTDETLGTLARRFLAGADPETQRRFNAFLVDVQADENA